MTDRTNNPERWTVAEHVAVYLPLAVVGLLLFGQACCEMNAVKFEFPASSRERTPVESRSNASTTRPAARSDKRPVAPARSSFSDRVVDEDAVIDAVVDDLMAEDTDE